MTKLNDYRPQPEPPPVRPPILPPDFPDIPQNSSSELQPPPEPSAGLDKVEGTTSEPAQLDPAKIELRRSNARLRETISQVLENHPELRDATDEIALKQGMDVQVGTPFLERIQRNLQERARAIIERRPDLEHNFDE